MRTIMKQVGFLSAALAVLALGSTRAVAMMGSDGPPPCESQACFIEAVAACKPQVAYMTATAAGARVQYLVEEPAGGGYCRLAMIYMQHPDPELTYKPLHFVVDPAGDIETQLKETVAECLSGSAEGDRQCSGPLLDISGAADD